LKERFERICSALDKLIDTSKSSLPPKRGWRGIAIEYWQATQAKEFTWTYGIPSGWLVERFDCSSLHIPDDMPFHARIGVGHHAGQAAVEEDFLLRDAFFMLVKCKESLLALENCRPALDKKRKLTRAEYKILSSFNQNVATYARNAVFGFYAFVECFINSVGEDFVLRHADVNCTSKELLRGRQSGCYLSTERKLELFPQLIRDDRMSPIRIRGVHPVIEPFHSFVTHVKAVRDAATHYARMKEPIIVSPQLWLQRAEQASSVCVDVARRFWQACYPSRTLPRYLGGLDPEKHLEIARMREAAGNAKL
jgi:hypothetical protein